MTCAWRARYAIPGLPREAILRLEQHAASCEECARRVALERGTYALLSSEPEPLATFERARLWARIDGARREQRRPWLGWAAFATALFAAVLFFALRPRETEPQPAAAPAIQEKVEIASGAPPPRGAWLSLEPGARIEVGRARLTAETRVVLSIPESPPLEEIWIADGSVRVEAHEATPRTIVTRAGRLLVFASDSRIFVDGNEVDVEVERGRVELQPEQGLQRTATVGKREALSPKTGKQSAPERDPKTGKQSAQRAQRAEPGARAWPERDPKTGKQSAQRAELGPIESQQRAKRVDIEVLMSEADQDRRAGDLATAERKYARAAEHPHGAPFREEALWRRASILAELGDTGAALRLLDRTQGGKLLPERTALKARLLLSRGDLSESAAILAQGGDHHVVDLARLDTARALLATDPRRAHALLLSIHEDGALGDEARALAAQAEARMINR